MTPSLNTESDPESGSSELPVLAVTAGQLLRKARLEAGIHLAVLSVTLKVPVRQLEALEADQLDPGKGPVFYRGLASSVCRHLQTDPAPILALLPQMSTHLAPLRSAIQPFSHEVSGPTSGLAWGRLASAKVVWSAAFMLFLTGALLWLPGPSQWAWLDDVKSLMADEVVSQDSGEPVSLPVLGATSPTFQAADAKTTPSPASAVSTVSTAATTAVVTQPMASKSAQMIPANPSTAMASSSAGRSDASPEWVFSASGDSWLEVRNAQKAVVWSGVVKAGESTRIQSPLPVSVVVGRAQVVTATLRGKAFDLKPHTQVTVARFEVKE
ncbi:helix-turn-helix domain-containing protein [Limnohabitans sp. Rim8]|uniref:helix-turn-helix domain-containing protein n=1 Tax=Limnohabitans sp. Rim8 TaxID=1100718 RepID=UPI0025CCD705|nr:helix-turn-helix domain-containing protein [Limnohabitans sp. Rim8]